MSLCFVCYTITGSLGAPLSMCQHALRTGLYTFACCCNRLVRSCVVWARCALKCVEKLRLLQGWQHSHRHGERVDTCTHVRGLPAASSPPESYAYMCLHTHVLLENWAVVHNDMCVWYAGGMCAWHVRMACCTGLHGSDYSAGLPGHHLPGPHGTVGA